MDKGGVGLDKGEGGVLVSISWESLFTVTLETTRPAPYAIIDIGSRFFLS